MKNPDRTESIRETFNLGPVNPVARWLVRAEHTMWQKEFEREITVKGWETSYYNGVAREHLVDQKVRRTVPGKDGTLTLEIRIPCDATHDELRDLFEKMRAIGFEFV